MSSASQIPEPKRENEIKRLRIKVHTLMSKYKGHMDWRKANERDSASYAETLKKKYPWKQSDGIEES